MWYLTQLELLGKSGEEEKGKHRSCSKCGELVGALRLCEADNDKRPGPTGKHPRIGVLYFAHRVTSLGVYIKARFASLIA
jgi:hypothetical protein